MKIDAPKSTSEVRSSRKLKRIRSGSKFSEVLESAQVMQTEANAPVSHVLSAHDILSIQEKPLTSPQVRGEKMLEALENLHNDLVMERSSHANLREMSYLLQERTQNVEDPKLQQILKQVEQRVAIELAKRGK